VSRKASLAFKFSAQSLFKDFGRVSFWCFTFKKKRDINAAFVAWDNLNRAMKRESPHWKGVRVAEVHPGGHGVHFHALLSGFIPFELVNEVGARFGFGHTSCEEANPGSIDYLAKYLTKPQPLLGRRRRWGCIGGYKGTRVRDIEVGGTLAENCRMVRKLLGVWGRPLFVEVSRLTMLYGHCLDWPEFPGLKPLHVHPVGDETGREPSHKVVRHVVRKIRLYDSESGEWKSHLLFFHADCPF